MRFESLLPDGLLIALERPAEAPAGHAAAGSWGTPRLRQKKDNEAVMGQRSRKRTTQKAARDRPLVGTGGPGFEISSDHAACEPAINGAGWSIRLLRLQPQQPADPAPNDAMSLTS